MSDWLEWLLKIGGAVATASALAGVLWWLAQRWELLQNLDEMLRDWHGQPPDREHPDGTPGVRLALERQAEENREQNEALREIKAELERLARIATNGLSTNVARSLEYSERAAEDATQAKETAAEAKTAAQHAAGQAEQLIEGQSALIDQARALAERFDLLEEEVAVGLRHLAEQLERQTDPRNTVTVTDLWQALSELGHDRRQEPRDDDGEDGAT